MKEKITTYSLLTVGTLAAGVLLFLLVKYILPVISPFLIAWVMALATRTPAKALSKRIRVPERVIRIMMSLFLTLFVFGAIALIIWQATAALWDFLNSAGEGSALYGFLELLSSQRLPFLGESIPSELAERISEALSAMLTALLTRLGEGITSVVGALPGVMLYLLVTVISLVYFAFDLERINGFVKSLLPKKAGDALTRLHLGIFEVGRRFVRSYFVLFLITYGILLLGFFALRVSRPMLLALFVAILDVLPVIGVGTVLIPWGVIETALGNHLLGIGLMVLFVINAAVRQFAEPKIVGKSLNMHPVLTLLLIYVGYALFGVMGLLALPIIAVIVGVILKKDHTAEVA